MSDEEAPEFSTNLDEVEEPVSIKRRINFDEEEQEPQPETSNCENDTSSNIVVEPEVESERLRTRLKHLSSLYMSVFLEMIDAEKAFEEEHNFLVDTLAKRGLQINTEQMKGYLDLLNTRLLKISAVKMMCQGMGLTKEMDDIVKAEIESLYRPLRVITK